MAFDTRRDVTATEWIVCLGALRDVVDGSVACPLAADEATTLEECLGCRRLALLSNEREPETSCSTDEPLSRSPRPGLE
jgi:hypothetical protein